MIVHRRDSRDITGRTEQELLDVCGLSGAEPLGVGTESKTYALDDDRVLKIYADPAQHGALDTLQDFYSRLSAPDICWQLPHIDSITEHGDLLAVIEHRIPGQPMEAFTASSSPQLESLYLKTVVAGWSRRTGQRRHGVTQYTDPVHGPTRLILRPIRYPDTCGSFHCRGTS
ncbi:hypothetical protein ACFU44_17475 [Nocardia rhizosphaerihabitans]|uniref:hypothetical protein n=1 Tax=Nocardia rhizosphaerihabitans TaxID=1691570 RepID=UPI00366E640D